MGFLMESLETLGSSARPQGSRLLRYTGNFERELVSDSRTQRSVDSLQMAEWVNYLAPWEVISHLTFRWEASLDSGRRCFEKFMKRHLPQATYFYALEQNPSRDGFHVHALWSDLQQAFRREVWASWFRTYGRARIEPVRNFNDVSGYCAKYCTKGNSWWNVHLQWHRKQAMHNWNFELREGSECASP